MSGSCRNFTISIALEGCRLWDKKMRTLALGLILSTAALPCVAQTILKTEPLSLAPYQSAYVSDGSCATGKVLRVTGAMRNLPRKKVCVSLGLEQALLSEQPL
jgi:Na+/glutamate symporter